MAYTRSVSSSRRSAWLAATYVAVDLSRLFADQSSFTSYCDIKDFFYANYLENKAKLAHPDSDLYRRVARKVEAHFENGCAWVRDKASCDAFLSSHGSVCAEACRGAAGKAALAAAECSALCELNVKTFKSFKPVR